MDKPTYTELVIHIHASSNGDGHYIDVYNDIGDIEESDPLDGAFCTGTLEQAKEWAKDFIDLYEGE